MPRARSDPSATSGCEGRFGRHHPNDREGRPWRTDPFGIDLSGITKGGAMVGLFESLGFPEILLILAVVLLLFGAKKLPEMARSLGRSSHEFKKGLKEGGVADEEEEAKKTSAEAKSDSASS